MIKVAFLVNDDRIFFTFRLAWAEALIKSGYEVDVISPPGPFFNKIKELGIRVIEYRLSRKSLNPFREIIAAFDLYLILRREKFDIVHTFAHKTNIYGTIAGGLCRVPIIINSVTGLGYLYSDRSIKAKIGKLTLNSLYRISLIFTSKVIFQNPDDERYFEEKLNFRKGILIKGSGVDTDYYSAKEIYFENINRLKKGLAIEEGDIVITLVARLLWQKGIKEFIMAANLLTQRHKNTVFIICGGLAYQDIDALDEDLIYNAGKNSKIKFIGKRDDIREVLYLTDIFSLPSYGEGIPRSILEAMAVGKPVITTDMPGCRETVEEGVNGFLVPPRDPAALAVAIEKLILDKELRYRMGKASREKVVKEFSNVVVIPQVLRLYQELLSGGNKSDKKGF